MVVLFWMFSRYCTLVIRKIGKWSEMSLFTIPVELAVSRKSLVRMWLVRVALALVTLVGLFMTSIKKFWKVKLR